jgi:predicted P-loop ATPase
MDDQNRRISEGDKRRVLLANHGRIKADCDHSLVKRAGKYRCPFGTHVDKTPSFNVFTDETTGVERFKCHGCGRDGDLFDWIEFREGLSFVEAYKQLNGETGTRRPALPPPPEPAPAPPRPELHQVLPEGVFTPRPGNLMSYIAAKSGEVKQIRPDFVHVYRNEFGRPIGVMMRQNLKPAPGETKPGKRIVCARYGVDGNWYNLGWTKAEGIPIYGRDLIEAYPSHIVVIVEGERKADWINALVGNDYIGVAWAHGGNNLGNVDWSCLHDRDVILWPDNDKPGLDGATRMLTEILPPHAPMAISRVFIPDGTPKKWDVVDFIEGLPDTPDRAIKLGEFLEKNSAHPLWTPTIASERKAQDLARAEQKKLKPKRTHPLPDWAKGLQWVRAAEGHVNRKNDGNLYLQLAHDPEFKDLIRYDVFDRVILFDGRPLKGVDIYRLLGEINAVQPHLTPGASNVRSVIEAIAEQPAFQVNRFADELRALKWDGVNRVMAEATSDGSQGLLSNYCGVERTDFTAAAGLRWMVSLVRRVCEPGIQADAMLVLEGAQGTMKTSFFHELGKICGRDVYGRLTSAALANDKDNLLKFGGKAIVELVEMTSQRKADEDALKAFLDAREDTYRPPYGREVETHPRHVVFGGTTNALSTYLSDPSGNRRFWPARVSGTVDTERLRQDVEQLWAEAMFWAYEASPTEQHWLNAREIEWQLEAVATREIEDPWLEILEQMVRRKSQVYNDDIYLELGILKGDRTWKVGQRIGDVMARLGWSRERETRGERRYVWYNVQTVAKN